MRITFCGVRGSTPAPGRDFARFGGHTSCVTIARDGEPARLVLDAGTGIRNVSDLFGGAAFTSDATRDTPPPLADGAAMDGSIVLGHLHWDHVQGLPFFGAANRPGSRVAVYAPAPGHLDRLIARFMSPPFFPIGPEGLAGEWSFHALGAGTHEIEGFELTCLEIPHAPGTTFGIRVHDGSHAVAYLSDHCPTLLGPGPDGLGAYHEAALALASDCEVLIHDAQLTDAEVPEKARFGHASCGYAVGLASRANVGELVLFHHDPARTDDEIERIVGSLDRRGIAVSAAFEGMVIDLPRR